MSESKREEVKNMKKAVSWAIKGVMHVRWWCFLFVSYAHYLALFVGRSLWDPGRKKMYNSFLYFHCKYVNNTINWSCGSIFFPFFDHAFCFAALKGDLVQSNNLIRKRLKRKTLQSEVKRKNSSHLRLMFPEKFIDKYNDFIQYLNTHSISLGQFEAI